MNSDLSLDLESAGRARIFFSHHSVGEHLLSGVQRLSREAGAGIALWDLDSVEAIPRAGWLHASGGQNRDPKSKVDFFVGAIERLQSWKPELAFMKLCYVDFNPRTDVAGLFSYYQKSLITLKQSHPEIRFAHVTVPLVARPVQLKWRLFRWVGREVWEDAANVKRFEFNQRLLQAFAADPLFDLARAESTKPDGTRETFRYAGGIYYALEPSYTSDGGHLNEFGERILGAEMIRFAAKALSPGAN